MDRQVTSGDSEHLGSFKEAFHPKVLPSFKDRKAIFDRLEQVASQANLTDEERARLEEDWKNYNDFFTTVDFAMMNILCNQKYTGSC